MPKSTPRLASLAYGATALAYAVGLFLARRCAVPSADDVALGAAVALLPAATLWFAYSWWTSVHKAEGATESPSLRAPALQGLLPFAIGMAFAVLSVRAECTGDLHGALAIFVMEVFCTMIAATMGFVVAGALAAHRRDGTP